MLLPMPRRKKGGAVAGGQVREAGVRPERAFLLRSGRSTIGRSSCGEGHAFFVVHDRWITRWLGMRCERAGGRS